MSANHFSSPHPALPLRRRKPDPPPALLGLWAHLLSETGEGHRLERVLGLAADRAPAETRCGAVGWGPLQGFPTPSLPRPLCALIASSRQVASARGPPTLRQRAERLPGGPRVRDGHGAGPAL